jgi:hypothetical protein
MSFLSLEESGRRFGSYVWAERRLFETLGGWSGDTDEPASRPVLAANAAHHAWRAGVLADRLPRARGLDVDGWIAPPNDEIAEAFAILARPGAGRSTSTARLVGVYRVVVPELLEAYRAHLGGLTEIADRPGRRWLGLVLHDEVDDQRRGEQLLAGRDEAETAVVDHRDRLRELVAEGWNFSTGLKAVQDPAGDEHAGTTRLP